MSLICSETVIRFAAVSHHCCFLCNVELKLLLSNRQSVLKCLIFILLGLGIFSLAQCLHIIFFRARQYHIHVRRIQDIACYLFIYICVCVCNSIFGYFDSFTTFMHFSFCSA